jgi:hypothetical protein
MATKIIFTILGFLLVTGPGALDAWLSLFDRVTGNEESITMGTSQIIQYYQLAFPFLGLAVLIFGLWWTRDRTAVNVVNPRRSDSQTDISQAKVISGSELSRAYLQGVDVRITDLTRESDLIQNRTFENCRIFGPAVLSLQGTSSTYNCTTEAPEGISSALFEVDPSRKWMVGPIGVLNCTFIRCTFTGIGFVGKKELIDKILSNTTNVPN